MHSFKAIKHSMHCNTKFGRTQCCISAGLVDWQGCAWYRAQVCRLPMRLAAPNKFLDLFMNLGNLVDEATVVENLLSCPQRVQGKGQSDARQMLKEYIPRTLRRLAFKIFLRICALQGGGGGGGDNRIRRHVKRKF